MSEEVRQETPAQRATRLRRVLVEAYRHTFEDTEAGMIVLAEMEVSLGRRPSFHRDPYLTAFHEGQRSMYLQVLELIAEAKRPPESDRVVEGDTDDTPTEEM